VASGQVSVGPALVPVGRNVDAGVEVPQSTAVSAGLQRAQVVALVRVDHRRGGDVLGVGKVGGLLSGKIGLRKNREEGGGKNRDNHEQFNEGEGRILKHKATPDHAGLSKGNTCANC